MPEPCGCGMLDCAYCHPLSYQGERSAAKLLAQIDNEHAGCVHVLYTTERVKRILFKRLHGLWWCKRCLLQEFERLRAIERGRLTRKIVPIQPPAA